MNKSNLNNTQLSYNNYKKPAQYLQQLEELNSGLNIYLEEFKKIYVISKMHPNDTEYQQQLDNITSNLNQLQSKVFSMSNEVQTNINDLNKQLHELYALIRDEKDKNLNINKKLGRAEHRNNAATEMIDNYKEMYNINYLRNWGLLLSIFLCVASIGYVYKKPIPSSVSLGV